MMRGGAIVFLWLLVCQWAAGCDWPFAGVELPGARTVADPGPVVARVGDSEIRLADIGPLAHLAIELRRAANLPEPETKTLSEQLDLAIELTLLAQGDAIDAHPPAAFVLEERHRLLARHFIRRLTEPVDQRVPSDDELERTYREEVDQYLRSGNSDLFEPKRVNAAVLSIGYFPDLKEHPDLDPVLGPEAARALALQARVTIGDAVADLDAFIEAGRALEREHPTVSLSQHWRIPLIQELTDWSPELFAALRELRVHGQISQVVVDRVGAHVIRLGTVFPGRGETLDSVRSRVERLWRRDRKRDLLQSELSALRRSYRIATWPDRLRDGLSPAAGADGGGSEP